MKKWLPHIAVALAYAAGFALLRTVSFSHWVLFAGFRLSVLLLLPCRYWPALLVGEMGPLAYTGLRCWDDLGPLWSMLVMIPRIGLAMPVVYFCKERLGMKVTRDEFGISPFLLCTLIVSLLWAMADGVLLSAAKLPTGYILPPYRVTLARWFLGNYLGILTLTPLAMMLRQYWGGLSIRQIGRRVIENRLWMELLPFLAPLLALVIWVLSGASEDVRQTMQMLMFVPVVWLSLKRGWQGAAIGGTLASVVIVLLMPSRYNQQTLQAQVFLSFEITAMLLLGGRIAGLVEKSSRESREARFALALAQRHVQLSEAQLLQAARALEQVREIVQTSHRSTMGQLRQLLPNLDERGYSRHVNEAQEQLYRLADTLYPACWQEQGISAALREGPMARALDEAGVAYWCDVRECGLEQLSQPIRMTLYRLANESIAHICHNRSVSDVDVRLRVGSFGGRRWAALRVDGISEPARLGRVRWDALLPWIARSSSGTGFEAIRNRVGIFQGRARSHKIWRAGQCVNRISMIVFDPETSTE